MKGGDYMPNYYYNNSPDENGYYEIHTENCEHLPKPPNRIYIGEVDSCQLAIAYLNFVSDKKFDGCYYCCRECHKG